jgi:adenylylsulfate kinase-like enzyme
VGADFWVISGSRDQKGWYRRARAIANFTGISDLYEAPLNPDLLLDTVTEPLGRCVAATIAPMKRVLNIRPETQDIMP